MIKSEKILFSRILVFIYLIIGLASYLSNGVAYNLLSLNPVIAVSNSELWRLFSFSFVPGNIEGTLLFSFVFWFIAPILEERFRTRKFALLLVLIASLQGAIFTLLFWGKPLNIAGGEGVALFVLTLYMFLEVSDDGNAMNFYARKIRSLPFVVLTTVVWFSSVLIHNSFVSNSGFTVSIIAGAFGIILGAIMFMQIKAADYLLGRRKSISSPVVNIPNPEELITSLHTSRKRALQNHFDEEDEYEEEFSAADYFSEDRLNAILDKINEQGKDSLTSDEKLYLEEYSKYL
jgi:membrane associated rhomboid family serine protease